MSDDHYAGSARRWADGATIVYAPIARQLVAGSRRPLAGHLVMDVGAGTGVVSTALTEIGARAIALDLSFDMLAWGVRRRPPSIVANVYALALRDGAVDDTVAAFVFNHLVDPAAGIAETARATRRGGALLACVYANASRSEVRDTLDLEAQRRGWRVPDWYTEMKKRATPLLGTAAEMKEAATRAGLVDVSVDERAVDVGVTETEQLVDYRLGQAQFWSWLDDLEPGRAGEVRAALIDVIRPIMRPYEPIVVFLSATVP